MHSMHNINLLPNKPIETHLSTDSLAYLVTYSSSAIASWLRAPWTNILVARMYIAFRCFPPFWSTSLIVSSAPNKRTTFLFATATSTSSRSALSYTRTGVNWVIISPIGLKRKEDRSNWVHIEMMQIHRIVREIPLTWSQICSQHETWKIQHHWSHRKQLHRVTQSNSCSCG